MNLMAKRDEICQSIRDIIRNIGSIDEQRCLTIRNNSAVIRGNSKVTKNEVEIINLIKEGLDDIYKYKGRYNLSYRDMYVEYLDFLIVVSEGRKMYSSRKEKIDLELGLWKMQYILLSCKMNLEFCEYKEEKNIYLARIEECENAIKVLKILETLKKDNDLNQLMKKNKIKIKPFSKKIKKFYKNRKKTVILELKAKELLEKLAVYNGESFLEDKEEVIKEINITLDMLGKNDIVKRIVLGKVEKIQKLFVERGIEVVLDIGGKEQVPYGPGTFEIKGKPYINESLIAYVYKTTAINDKCRFGVVCEDSQVELEVLVGDFLVKIHDSDTLVSSQSSYTTDDLSEKVDKALDENKMLYKKNMSNDEVTSITKNIVENELKTIGLEVHSLSVKNKKFR